METFTLEEAMINIDEYLTEKEEDFFIEKHGKYKGTKNFEKPMSKKKVTKKMKRQAKADRRQAKAERRLINKAALNSTGEDSANVLAAAEKEENVINKAKEKRRLINKAALKSMGENRLQKNSANVLAAAEKVQNIEKDIDVLKEEIKQVTDDSGKKDKKIALYSGVQVGVGGAALVRGSVQFAKKIKLVKRINKEIKSLEADIAKTEFPKHKAHLQQLLARLKKDRNIALAIGGAAFAVASLGAANVVSGTKALLKKESVDYTEEDVINAYLEGAVDLDDALELMEGFEEFE